jgi:hypothetical protein
MNPALTTYGPPAAALAVAIYHPVASQSISGAIEVGGQTEDGVIEASDTSPTGDARGGRT